MTPEQIEVAAPTIRDRAHTLRRSVKSTTDARYDQQPTGIQHSEALPIFAVGCLFLSLVYP